MDLELSDTPSEQWQQGESLPCPLTGFMIKLDRDIVMWLTGSHGFAITSGAVYKCLRGSTGSHPLEESICFSKKK